MIKIELVKFEAQDVITTSVAAPAVPAHKHHWSLFAGGEMVGVGDNKSQVSCQEEGCTSTLIVEQPAGFSYEW